MDVAACLPLPTVESLTPEEEAYYRNLGYFELHRFRGEVIGISVFLFTVGIVVGMDESGYKYLYCYDSAQAALEALHAWIRTDDEDPKGFIKKKGIRIG